MRDARRADPGVWLQWRVGVCRPRLLVAMTSLFFSYTHKDEALRDELEAHLSLLKHQGLIDVWHDRRIMAGDVIDDTISRELEQANIILLLVSSNFLASSYCYSREMQRAMERHEAGETRVIPVILRSCDWHSAPFGKLNGVPRDGRAVTLWPDRDEAFTDVARQIRTAVEGMAAAKAKGMQQDAAGTAAGAPVMASPKPAATKAAALQSGAVWQAVSQPDVLTGTASPRSSNLRVKKEFTDLDRDNFVHDCFEFMVKFFDGSIAAIKERSADLDGRVERIDSRRFAASLYRGGKAIAQCSVQRGGPASIGRDDRSISFSYGSSPVSGSLNEQVSVQSTDQALYMKALGFGNLRGRSEQQQLSVEGAAELFWGMFIERAQV